MALNLGTDGSTITLRKWYDERTAEVGVKKCKVGSIICRGMPCSNMCALQNMVSMALLVVLHSWLQGL